jgi:hypothetical protein
MCLSARGEYIIKTFFMLVCLIPLVSFGACNHHIVDRSKKLACVTIKNESSNVLSVTSLNGIFNLKPNASEESIIIPGGLGSVKILPIPFVPYISKALTCSFTTADARRNRITITYAEKQFLVAPSVFHSKCHYTDLTHINKRNV